MTEDAFESYPSEAEMRQREDDLRVRMVALDMSITALPHYENSISNPRDRVEIHNGLIARFEKYLRTGELGS